MLEITETHLFFVGVVAASLILTQLLLGVYLIASLRSAERERAAANKELFGLVRKLEGLTSHKREAMTRHYDKMLETLMARLPVSIAARAGEQIFETESKILSRLAELEQSSKEDEGARVKTDELIKSMEKLEQTVVSLTAETVQKVMSEGRRALFEEQSIDDFSAAA